MIFKKNLMNFIIISIVFATILISKNWALYRNSTKIKKVYFFGNEFVDNNFLNSFNDEIKNTNAIDTPLSESVQSNLSVNNSINADSFSQNSIMAFLKSFSFM